MAANVAYVYIYSNDGTRVLHEYLTGANLLTVTDKGCLYNDSVEWTYTGTNTFLGFATSPNAKEPTYAIGDSVRLTLGGSDAFYIVERKSESSGVTVEYNGSVVATIENGNQATLPIKDLKMKSDIKITVPEAEVLPEFTEVEDFAVLANGADEGSLELAYSVSQDVKLSAASPAPLVSIDDANFIANNIKKDVSIFGLTGAYEAEDKATPIEVSTEAEMTALLTSGEVGGVYKYTGTTGTYENGALYVLEEEAASITINGWGNVAGWQVSIANVTSSTTWADVASNNSYYQVVNTSQSTGNGSAVILVDANNANIVKLDYSGGGGYYPVYKGVNGEGGAVYGSDLVLSQSVYYAGAETVGGGGAN